MNADELRALQAPLKERYKEHPGAALITLSAQGRLGGGIACNVQTGKALHLIARLCPSRVSR